MSEDAPVIDVTGTDLAKSGEAFAFGELGGWILGGFEPGGTKKPVGELRSVSQASENLKVIDCDTHLTEPPNMWLDRMPAGMKDKAPYVQHIQGIDCWAIGDKPIGTLGGSVIDSDGNKILGRLGYGTYNDIHPASYDIKSRLKIMDEFGIYAQICYPNSFAASSVSLLKWVDEHTAKVLIEIYNDDRADRQKESNGRIFPAALLPFWDQKAMEKEAVRCIEELDLKSFNMPDRPEQFGLPSFVQDYWAPLFEICNTYRKPINFHIATGGIDGFQYTWEGFTFERKLAVGSMLFYIGNAATLGNFLLSGLFDKYENLKMVSVESGAGWVPFVLEAMEYQIDEMMPVEKKSLKRRPIEYFRDHCYACYWFENQGPQHFLDTVGPNNLLFESDFPHPTSLYPDIQEHIQSSLGDMDGSTRRRILQDNAAELYGIAL